MALREERTSDDEAQRDRGGRRGSGRNALGAGAPMTSPFMETITGLLTQRGLQVTRFEFAYMAARRDGGKRRPPPKAELLAGE